MIFVDGFAIDFIILFFILQEQVREAFIMPPTSTTMVVNVEPSPSYFAMSICLSLIDFSFLSRVTSFRGYRTHG
jgi:hypothetical protein